MISLVTNVDTVTTLKNLDKTQRALSSNIGRLSSGLRINKASDDAAGLAISEQLKAQIRALGQAQRNAMDGISMIQVAEGGMNEIANALIRLRELGVQAANGTQNTTTRGYLNTEYRALISEIDRIANVTKFNGTALINSSFAMKFWVGANAASSENAITVSTADMNVVILGTGTSGIAGTHVSTLTQAVTALGQIDSAISEVSAARARLGAAQNRLTLAVDSVASQRENMMAANSRIRDVDISAETSDFTRNQILTQAGVSVLAQANQLPQVGLSLLK